ncbi:swi5-like zinc finger protein [Mortierella sp. NVP85]|nr:swi5-like zinc finger protein [Mortierella sp. NVP85]
MQTDQEQALSPQEQRRRRLEQRRERHARQPASPTDLLSSTDNIHDLLELSAPSSPRTSRRRRNEQSLDQALGQRTTGPVDDGAATNVLPAVPESVVAPEPEDRSHKYPIVTEQDPSIETLAKAAMASVPSKTHQSMPDSQDDAALRAKEDAKITELKATIKDLQRQEQEIMKAIRGEGTPSDIIDRHIKQLHRYNEIKDAGQIILGKCAELEGTTIKKQYEIFGLDPED